MKALRISGLLLFSRAVFSASKTGVVVRQDLMHVSKCSFRGYMSCFLVRVNLTFFIKCWSKASSLCLLGRVGLGRAGLSVGGWRRRAVRPRVVWQYRDVVWALQGSGKTLNIRLFHFLSQQERENRDKKTVSAIEPSAVRETNAGIEIGIYFAI